jgi:predicted RNase H-like HicB family nuclease
MHTYTVVLQYDPGAPGYSVSVRALPGCYTQGDTGEEALMCNQGAMFTTGLSGL